MFFAPSEKGQGLVEYAVIIIMIIWIVWAIMRLPKCGNLFDALLVFKKCGG